MDAMTPDERRRAILTIIAAKLEIARADQQIKRYMIPCGRHMSTATVHHVLKGGDHRVSTLVEIADALNCDVEIEFRKRSA